MIPTVLHYSFEYACSSTHRYATHWYSHGYIYIQCPINHFTAALQLVVVFIQAEAAIRAVLATLVVITTKAAVMVLVKVTVVPVAVVVVVESLVVMQVEVAVVIVIK